MKEPRSQPTQTVTKALSLLDLFSEQTPEWMPADMAKHLGLNQSTAHRLITTMEAMGYVERNPRTGRLRPGLRMIELGYLALSQQPLFRQTLPLIQEFSRRTGAQVTLAILYAGRTMYLSRVEPPHVSSGGPPMGRVVPSYCTAVGKVLLSYLATEQVEVILADHGMAAFTPNTVVDPTTLREQLDKFREDGYSVVLDEWIQGNGGVAAPVRDSSGEVVAAVALSGPTEMFGPQDLPQMIAEIKDCAAKASFLLGYSLAYA